MEVVSELGIHVALCLQLLAYLIYLTLDVPMSKDRSEVHLVADLTFLCHFSEMSIPSVVGIVIIVFKAARCVARGFRCLAAKLNVELAVTRDQHMTIFVSPFGVESVFGPKQVMVSQELHSIAVLVFVLVTIVC